MAGTKILHGTGLRFRCVLFDLDNTLYDFASAKEKACKKVIKAIGRGDAYDLMSNFIFSPYGVENPRVIKDYLAGYNITDEEVVSEAVRIYVSTKMAEIVPYPGVYDTLIKLDNAGLKIGAVTNASTDNAIERLSKIQVIDLLDCLVTPENSGFRKPDSAIFIHTSALLQVEPHQTLFVGDNLVNDIRPASQTGMCTVHAKYGDRLPPEYSEGIVPDYSISAFPEILNIIGL